MSLLSSMTRDLGITKRVRLSDVRLNDLNFYDYQDSIVESLKKSILKDGQMENAIVYEVKKMNIKVGTKFIHKGHEVIIKDKGIENGKTWITIEPTGNYGFPIDVWYDHVKKEIRE